MDGTWLVSNWKLGMEIFVSIMVIFILLTFLTKTPSYKLNGESNLNENQSGMTPRIIFSSKPEIYIMVLANLAGLSC